MSRNLVVCCDGTGNIWGNNQDTNVVKLVRLLVKNDQQLLYYDPGVGTSDTYPAIGWGNRFRARTNQLLGLAIGGGVYENIGSAYGFVVDQYHPGDRLFFFGFSRGAFTARCVAGMVNLFGIVCRGSEPMIPTLTRIYFQPIEGVGATGKDRKSYGEDIRGAFAREGRDARVHFIGVWDTVSSVGGLPLFKKNISSSGKIQGKNYNHIRHAVALHEYRYPYAPRLFSEPCFENEKASLKQYYFAGAHSDVGGSYDEDGLSNCSLKWMVEEAMAKGLQCDQTLVDKIKPNPLALAHDQPFRQSLWALSGLQTRPVSQIVPKHESLKTRELALKSTPRPKTEWTPLLRNPRVAVSAGFLFAMLLVLYLLGNWACLSTCDGEFNFVILKSLIEGRGGWDVFGTVNTQRMTLRYIADLIFIVAYTYMACWVLVYARRALAERTANAHVHQFARWAGLLPLWALIGSDIIENLASLFLASQPVGVRDTHVVLLYGLGFFTGMKLLAMLALAGYFIWLGATLVFRPRLFRYV
jgi:hypothetical protein